MNINAILRNNTYSTRALNNMSNGLTAINNNISNLNNKIDNIEMKLSNMNADIAKHEIEINNNTKKMETLENNISEANTKLANNMPTLNNNIIGVSDKVGVLETHIREVKDVIRDNNIVVFITSKSIDKITPNMSDEVIQCQSVSNTGDILSFSFDTDSDKRIHLKSLNYNDGCIESDINIYHDFNKDHEEYIIDVITDEQGGETTIFNNIFNTSVHAVLVIKDDYLYITPYIVISKK